MTIQLTDTAVWDTEAARQSDEAMQWLRATIMPQMRMCDDQTGISPEYDSHKRPIRWVIPAANCTVVIEREYVRQNSSDWGMKTDKITVYGN